MKAPIFLFPHDRRLGHAKSVARDLAAMPDCVSQMRRLDHEMHQSQVALEKLGLAPEEVDEQLEAFADLINDDLVRLDHDTAASAHKHGPHDDRLDKLFSHVFLYGNSDRKRIEACLWIAASIAARSNAVTVDGLKRMLQKAHVKATAIVPDKETKGSL